MQFQTINKIKAAPNHPKSVFREWLPAWLRVPVALVILIPILLINGAYNGCSIDISGFFGVLSEDINFAFFTSAAGMAVAYPMSRRIQIVATPKTILLTSFISEILLSLVCLHANHIEIIAVASFFIGFMKAFSLMEMLVILIPIFKSSDKRSRFYSVYYPITLGIGQFSMILTAELAYNYKWQYMYYLMIALLLFAVITILVCLRYARRPVRIPVKEIDWLDMALISTFLIALIYVFTYGKVKDWFDSPLIWVGIGIMFFTIIPFVRRQLLSDDPYIDPVILKYRNTRAGYFIVFILLLLAQTNPLISSYTTSVLRLDSIHSNTLYIWQIPGFILAAPLCYWWYEKNYSVKIITLIGFGCIIIFNTFLYFRVHTQGTYESLYSAMVFKGFGLLILYVVFGVYVLEQLPVNKRLSNAFFIIGIRSILIPVIGSSLFINWLYRLQVKNTMVLSENLNLQNPLATDRYTQAIRSALSQGMSIQDAQTIATTNLYNTVQVQAILVSIKTILGYCIIIGLLVAVFIALFPFYKKGKESNATMGTDMV